MPRATSPYGEVLTIPAEGVHAMRALGWDVEDDEPTTPTADADATVDSTDSEPEPEEKPARPSRAKK